MVAARHRCEKRLPCRPSIRSALRARTPNTKKQGEDMLAYFVHDPKKNEDVIVIPDMHCSVRVDPERFENFISAKPNFVNCRRKISAR